MQFQKKAVSALVAGLVMAVTGVVPAAAQKSLCNDLKQILKAGEQNFKPLRGKVVVRGDTWKARLAPAGTNQCEIDDTVGGLFYSCESSPIPDRSTAERRQAELAEIAVACFPEGKVDRGVGKAGATNEGLPFTGVTLGTGWSISIGVGKHKSDFQIGIMISED